MLQSETKSAEQQRAGDLGVQQSTQVCSGNRSPSRAIALLKNLGHRRDFDEKFTLAKWDSKK